jgi:hypothetical protein
MSRKMTVEMAKSIELGQTEVQSVSTQKCLLASYRCQFYFKGSLYCLLSSDGVQWFDYQDLEII